MSILNSWWRALAGVLFPPRCVVCDEPLEGETEQLLCERCLRREPHVEFAGSPEIDRFKARYGVERVSAAMLYNRGGGWYRPIAGFKYHGRRGWARWFGAWLGAALKQQEGYDDLDCVIPVPLHPVRQLWRGYNQSRYLAEGIAEVLGVPVEGGALVRDRYTSSQTRKRQQERAGNVAHAFRVTTPERLSGLHVLLVDDVMTTGSTLGACCDALRETVPDVRISVAVLAASPRLV